MRDSHGDECDMALKNNIEGIIIKWAYQSDEACRLISQDEVLFSYLRCSCLCNILQVLSKDSSELLNAKGKYPGPMTEIKFWEAKCMNLESLYEQMKAPTTKNMASILENTDR